MSEAAALTVRGGTVSSPPQRSAGTYFPTLDGYRAMAALAVVVFHVLGDVGLDQGQWYSPYTKPLGEYGVAIFFLLSGFLLYRPFVLAYLMGVRPASIRTFYTRRFFRIFPAYWAALVAYLFVFDLGRATPHSASAYLSYFTLTQIYRSDPSYLLGGLFVAWTLCIEVSFYAVLPLISAAIAFIGRRARSVRSRLRVQFASLAVLYLVALGYRFVNASYLPVSMAMQRSWLQSYLDYFALGMSLAAVSAWIELGGNVSRAFAWCAQWPAIPLFFAAEFYFFEMRLGNPGLFEVFTDTQRVWQQTCFGLSAAFLLFPGVFGPARRGIWRRVLASREMTRLGLVSFGIYLWHPIWLGEIQKFIVRGQYDDSFWLVLVPVLLITVASAALSYRLVEQPMMRLGRRVAGHGTRRPNPPGDVGSSPGIDAPPGPQRGLDSSAAASSASTAASHV